MATLDQYSHPSFGLGNIAQPEAMDVLDKIRACEAQIDAAHNRLDTVVSFKRSMTMTLNELSDMGVDTASLSEKIAQIDAAITDAAAEYVDVRIGQENAIGGLKKTLSDLPATQMPESPIDFQASRLVARPFAGESLKLDSQYFSFSGNLQEDKLASIEKFIRSSTGNVASRSDELSRSVCDQISDQVENHDVCGTLILTASCTHRNTQLFSPLVIDADRAVDAWNSIREDKIDTSSPTAAFRALSDDSDPISLITGAVYGSSFIGMAHFLRSETDTKGNLDDLRGRLEKRLMTGGWLADASGEVGIDRAMMDEVRGFLSANSISCHIGIVAMGAIPTIKSDSLKSCVHRLAENSEVRLSSLDDDAEVKTVKSGADSARRRALLNTVQNARIGSILTAVSKSDESNNAVLDMKTLIEAFDNYIETIREKDEIVGVPIGFYVRRLTKAEIAKCWLKRYYPEPDAKEE